MSNRIENTPGSPAAEAGARTCAMAAKRKATVKSEDQMRGAWGTSSGCFDRGLRFFPFHIFLWINYMDYPKKNILDQLYGLIINDYHYQLYGLFWINDYHNP